MIYSENPYLDTEFQELTAVSEVREGDGYKILRSKLFPSYYDGNCLWYENEVKGDLIPLIRNFKEHFCPPAYNHVNLVIEKCSDPQNLIQEAIAGEFTYANWHSFMVAKEHTPFAVEPAFQIRQIISDEDWGCMLEHISACNPGFNWAITEGYEIMKNKTDTLGTKWFGIFESGTETIMASLGVFQYGNLARLQDVQTAPEYYRMGHGTRMMKFIMNYCFQTLRVDEIVLCADKGYHAFNWYKSLGFIPTVEILKLEKYS